jgi:hypothetical protein
MPSAIAEAWQCADGVCVPQIREYLNGSSPTDPPNPQNAEIDRSSR